MDGSRFDDLSRTLAIGATRRRALRLLCGAAVAGFASGLGRGAASSVLAQADREDAARRRPFWNRWGPCASSEDCGRLVPCIEGICSAVSATSTARSGKSGQNRATSASIASPSPTRRYRTHGAIAREG